MTGGTDRCEKEKRITGPTNLEAGQTAGYKTVDRRRSQHQSRLTSLSCSTQAANMKVVIVLLAVAVCVLAEEKYTTKYDNIDLDQILRSERLLNNYVNCLLEKGSCTPDGKELKKSLPDALQNKCSKCSEKQKSGSEKVIRYLIHEKPQVWERLSKKYDPTGVHTENFKEDAKQRGIIL